MARIEVSGGAPVLALLPDDEYETPPLPREFPKWTKDALAVSQRARQLIAKLRPVLIRVLTFWDHHKRCALIGGRELQVDISGSYRID
jgi:hypothetical protein